LNGSGYDIAGSGFSIKQVQWLWGEEEVRTYSDRALKKPRIVIFFVVLICSVKMTWTGNKIKHRSVAMFITATPRQKPVYRQL
jgi:hypothetical protein